MVLLEAGDAVPADGRILESASMKIEEAALTGESVPVNKIVKLLNLDGEKDVPLGDRKNMMVYGFYRCLRKEERLSITGTGNEYGDGKNRQRPFSGSG